MDRISRIAAHLMPVENAVVRSDLIAEASALLVIHRHSLREQLFMYLPGLSVHIRQKSSEPVDCRQSGIKCRYRTESLRTPVTRPLSLEYTSA